MSRGTKGSHSPTLIRIVERTLDEETEVAPGHKLLLAVSGGSDSTALLHVLAGLATSRGLVLLAHGIDHGLRPEATDELDLAESLATRLGIPFSRSRVSLLGHGNTQAKARELRYAALRERAAQLGANYVVTAHHATDRAETVLLRLLRGTGLSGLGVMPVCEGDLLRPLLRAQKTDVRLHLQRHGLEYASDPSNENTRYARVRVRSELLPLMETLDPNLVLHLCALADDAVTARVALDSTPSADPGADPSADPSEGPRTTLFGRRQRVALERAIALEQVGFELPVGDQMTLVLQRKKVS